uniref:Uncharacterized protein n=1 Tax=Ciona intestinalis TaxID=7719 RepID=H2Y165_CIOIN
MCYNISVYINSKVIRTGVLFHTPHAHLQVTAYVTLGMMCF